MSTIAVGPTVFFAVPLATSFYTTTSFSSVATSISSSSIIVDPRFESLGGGSEGLYFIEKCCRLLCQFYHLLHLLLHFLVG